MKIKSFRNLRVWQLAIEVVELVYRLTRSFPRSEVYGLASQIQRAAVSVPSNIAEGHTREHTKNIFNICPSHRRPWLNLKRSWKSQLG
jgi:hypothetical protein